MQPSILRGLCLALFTASVTTVASQDDKTQRPNIVLILTDDQDVGTLQRRFLPNIFDRLVDHGVSYDNFFAPVSVCCPSRVSLLRAQYAHNHNVTFVSRPWGGWEIFNEYHYVNHTLPDFLQTAGYSTYYTGKLMNGHTVENCERLPVSGFNSSDFLVDPYTYDYWNPAFSRDNGPAIIHPNTYSTDLVKEKALDYLEEASQSDQPFFLTVAPIGPHSWIASDGRDPDINHIHMEIPAAAPRHASLFPAEQIPRTESFNPDRAGGVSWVKHLPKANDTVEAYWDDFYRGRLRALQAIDELVGEVVDKLDQIGQLDNTYIFYTSDNGYAIGSHRRQPGKTLGYEEDIHVPLIVRGPNVPVGLRDTASSWGMVDLSKTIMQLAGARADYVDDGRVIDLHSQRVTTGDGEESGGEHEALDEKARHAISEYWVLGAEEGVFAGPLRVNNTYRTVRVHQETDNAGSAPATYSYSVWCTGERELYDLNEDPHQIHNLLTPLNSVGRFAPFDSLDGKDQPLVDLEIQRLLHRLDALMLVLKTCKGSTCADPYSELVRSSRENHSPYVPGFQHLLDPNFDDYFTRLPKVHFKECALGYHRALEQPEWHQTWALDGSVDKLTDDSRSQVVLRT
ncbi:hypothetical protein QFC24_000026 [Naganishia onofrii]|uniref:Uncharacterized protein n=1 Tax=Naganishia onofrii TaxID=1851511 RepID=A0ACC2XVS9_9TREE|nr:hypothetical protein QFC24_000026 [Naganishia onofrii]